MLIESNLQQPKPQATATPVPWCIMLSVSNKGISITFSWSRRDIMMQGGILSAHLSMSYVQLWFLCCSCFDHIDAVYWS